jgi:hypothetical protein
MVDLNLWAKVQIDGGKEALSAIVDLLMINYPVVKEYFRKLPGRDEYRVVLQVRTTTLPDDAPEDIFKALDFFDQGTGGNDENQSS